MQELSQQMAGLPTQLASESEEPKRFDLIVLQLQLSLLRGGAGFAKLRDTVIQLASSLEEQSSIPVVQQQLAFIQEVQQESWWTDITLPMLEHLRRRLRGLMKLMEKKKRPLIFTNFEDEIGEAQTIELPGFAAPGASERFRAKVRQRRTIGERQAQICRHQILSMSHLIPVQFDHLKGRGDLGFRLIRDREQLAGPDQVRNPKVHRQRSQSVQKTSLWRSISMDASLMTTRRFNPRGPANPPRHRPRGVVAVRKP